MVWNRGSTRIAYVVKIVRYVGRAVAQRGVAVADRVYRGQYAPTLTAGMMERPQGA